MEKVTSCEPTVLEDLVLAFSITAVITQYSFGLPIQSNENRSISLDCICPCHRFQHLIVSHCILRNQRSNVESVLAKYVKSVITVFVGADLWDRVTKPLKTALDTAAMSMEMIDQVRID